MDGEGCNWQKGKEQRELVNEIFQQKSMKHQNEVLLNITGYKIQ